MIEVFKTNVIEESDAAAILEKIRLYFPDYTANFDLQDCDHVLRVKSHDTLVHSETLIGLVRAMGFEVNYLPDLVNELLLREILN